jgi:predicted dehydrogenase
MQRRAPDGRRLRAGGVLLQVGFNQRFWAQVQIARRSSTRLHRQVHAFRSVFERWTPIRRRRAIATMPTPAAPHHRSSPHRSRATCSGDFAAVCAELAHSVVPDAVDDNVWLLARFASGARGCLSSDRYSPAIADGTDIYGSAGTIHIATETQNPFHATPLAVYTERPAAELPAVLREAHYPDAWWKSFEGGWIAVRPPRRNPYDAPARRLHRQHPRGQAGDDLRRRRAARGGRAGRLSLGARQGLDRVAAARRRAVRGAVLSISVRREETCAQAFTVSGSPAARSSTRSTRWRTPATPPSS